MEISAKEALQVLREGLATATSTSTDPVDFVHALAGLLAALAVQGVLAETDVIRTNGFLRELCYQAGSTWMDCPPSP